MLDAQKLATILNKFIAPMVLLFLLILTSACLPQAKRASLSDGNNSTNTDNKTTLGYPEPAYPYAVNFVQEGGSQVTGNFALPLNFNDSFLLRGKELSQLVRSLPNTTQFCAIAKYAYLPGTDKFLLLTAKPKSYTDLVKKTTEFYLQVEPNNDTANQNDCLNYNVTNALFAGASNPTVSFSLAQLCTDCTSAVTSGGLVLFVNGAQSNTVNISNLFVTISGSTSSNSNSCVESTLCQSRGYNCCLENQCAKDGAVKPGSILQPGFAAALADVTSDPDRFVIYPQYYFVCPNRPNGSSSGGSGGGPADPDYDAAVRLMELNQLYQCINKVDGEFSYCTVKFEGASDRIPGNFSAGENPLLYNDDITFSTLVTPFAAHSYRKHNIVKIFYAGLVLYDAAAQDPLDPLTEGSLGPPNNLLTSAQTVSIVKDLPSNAKDDNLYITYKIDGTCTRISSSLARCTKTYIQGSTDTSSSMWHNSGNTYALPMYANMSMSIIVKVSETVLPDDPTNWNKSGNSVVLVNTPFTNQKVEITYYVSGTDVAAVLKSKTEALSKLNTMCNCSQAGCNLKPIYNTSNALVNYECLYPTPGSAEPPANQTVVVSAKHVPHRFFNQGGVAYDENFGQDTIGQEGAAAFTYFNNDLLKPSNVFSNSTTANVNNYVGFNEVYGSFSKTANQTAKPAKLVKVKKDKFYDIYVNTGAFSACPTCGSDYYTFIQKIFPNNFAAIAGGYTPDNWASNRENATSLYRSDDLLFGRACFLPVTMIPWTHVTSPTANTVQNQRLTRLAGQHFLFANGYNRDWFGFDYGSLIGSFDGVTWFSIGNSRRIKASTNKLFLAVNAYFGDLTIDNSFNVNISETVTGSSTMADHDTKTDGAECQKSHYCATDNDCIRQLGYDYTCQNISGLTTNWPQFDLNGNEIIGSTSRTLTSLIGGNASQAKRCMYRGRGAPCHQSLSNLTGAFNGAGVAGAVGCSPNNMCQSFTVGTTSRFNDKISRFANTPVAQNTQNLTLPVSDIVGLGARIIGRPYDYYGTKAIPSGPLSSLSSLTANNVASVCIPGKNISTATTVFELNTHSPSIRKDSSDKMFGVGSTMPGTMSPKYYDACPATDTTGAYLHQMADTSGLGLPLGISQSALEKLTVTQNLSTNLLNTPLLVNAGVFNSSAGSTDTQITAVGYQRNACLRAPGSACFSDMECAPSGFIGSKVRSLDLSSVMNPAEKKFWEEDLVCGNPDFKYVSPGVKNTDFNIKNNACCREYGKTMTVYTETATSAHQWCDFSTNKPKIAGINIAIGSSNRYSRVNTAYDKMTCNRLDPELGTTKSFALSMFALDQTDRLTQVLRQYKTLDTINQRTCCTKNWVRSFDTSNGGGHAWDVSKQQTIAKSLFQPYNWRPNQAGPDNATPFECEWGKHQYPSCEINSFNAAQEAKYLTFFGSLELLGIPQVAVKVAYPYEVGHANYGNTGIPLDDILSYPVDATTQAAPATLNEPPANTIKLFTGANHDFQEAGTHPKRYYSASDSDKFNIGPTALKKVFSENEFNCCIPSNKEVPTTVTAEQCCTGYVANRGSSTMRRCCLPDKTDVTLYLNRYVSSEGRGLPDSAYDPRTGYIIDPGVVEVMAYQKNLCCSGKTTRGTAIWNLHIPLTGGTYQPTGTGVMTRRFVTRDDAVDNTPDSKSVGSHYDAGFRWNNHVYCIGRDDPNPYD